MLPNFLAWNLPSIFFSKKILPASFSKRFALRDIKKKIREKVDKTCGRIRWDLMDRIRKSFFNFRWDLNEKIEDTEQNIRQAIDRAMKLKKKNASEIESAQKDISNILREVEDAKDRLERIERRLPLAL